MYRIQYVAHKGKGTYLYFFGFRFKFCVVMLYLKRKTATSACIMSSGACFEQSSPSWLTKWWKLRMSEESCLFSFSS